MPKSSEALHEDFAALSHETKWLVDFIKDACDDSLLSEQAINRVLRAEKIMNRLAGENAIYLKRYNLTFVDSQRDDLILSHQAGKLPLRKWGGREEKSFTANDFYSLEPE